MTNVIPFVPRIVKKAEEDMSQVVKTDWATVEPQFSFGQVESGGFAAIEGLVPMEIALLMMNGIESYKVRRTAATTKRVARAKRAGKKKRPN